MNEPPYIGCRITVASDWPDFTKSKDGEPYLMKAYVRQIKQSISKDATCFIYWRAGGRRGQVTLKDEGIEWVRGHGPIARASLLAARKLVES